MTPHELETAFATLGDLWPAFKGLNTEQRLAWTRALADAPAGEAVEALRVWAATRKWNPKPCEIAGLIRAKQSPTAKAPPTRADVWRRRAIGHGLPVEGRPARQIALDVLAADAAWSARVYGVASPTRQHAFREWQRARFKLGHRPDELPADFDRWPEADRAEYEELAPPREEPAHRELSEAAL